MTEFMLIVLLLMNIGVGLYFVMKTMNKQKAENKRLKEELHAMHKEMQDALDRFSAVKEEEAKLKSVDPMEALLLKMIAETDSEDKEHLDQVRKAWNFQPTPSRKIDRTKGDS